MIPKMCFKCARSNVGKPRRSAGQTASFYSVALSAAARTVYLCDDCYRPRGRARATA